MKNLLKMSLLGLVVVVCAIGCDPSNKPATNIDTAKVDTLKKDSAAAKPDTMLIKKDTIKK